MSALNIRPLKDCIIVFGDTAQWDTRGNFIGPASKLFVNQRAGFAGGATGVRAFALAAMRAIQGVHAYDADLISTLARKAVSEVVSRISREDRNTGTPWNLYIKVAGYIEERARIYDIRCEDVRDDSSSFLVETPQPGCGFHAPEITADGFRALGAALSQRLAALDQRHGDICAADASNYVRLFMEAQRLSKHVEGRLSAQPMHWAGGSIECLVIYPEGSIASLPVSSDWDDKIGVPIKARRSDQVVSMLGRGRFAARFPVANTPAFAAANRV